MTLIVALLLLALLFGGAGFAAHILWIIALVFAVGCMVAYLTGSRRL